jgi:gluconate kinase
MVILVMGADRCERNSLGRMLAITLSWEFADARQLLPTYVAGVAENIQTVEGTGLEILSAALRYPVYNWHDMVVSCWTLSEQERKLLGRNLPLIKFVYLRSPEHRFEDASFEVKNGIVSVGKPQQNDVSDRVLTVDPSRKTKEIIAEILAVLVLNRRSQHAIAS